MPSTYFEPCEMGEILYRQSIIELHGRYYSPCHRNQVRKEPATPIIPVKYFNFITQLCNILKEPVNIVLAALFYAYCTIALKLLAYKIYIFKKI